MQLGDLTLKKHRVQVLDRQIAELPDFREVFVTPGRGAEGSAIACAEVAVTSQRRWLRLLGRRHDVRLWTTPDPRPVQGLHASSSRARRYPEQLDANAEAWIRAALQDHTAPGGQLGGFAITLPAATTSATAPFVVLGGELSFTPAGGATITAMKEIVILRSPLSVQVFDVVEHGRRWYRTLAWVTDSSLTLYDAEHDAVSKRGMDPAQRSKLPPTWPTKVVYDRARGGLRIEAGDARRYLPPAHSLVITRHLNAALGRQRFVPERLLRGVLPSALLSFYRFWQSCDAAGGEGVDFADAMEEDVAALGGAAGGSAAGGSYGAVPAGGAQRSSAALWHLVAYELDVRRDPSKAPTMLRITVVGRDRADRSGQGRAPGRAIVQRVELEDNSGSIAHVSQKLGRVDMADDEEEVRAVLGGVDGGDGGGGESAGVAGGAVAAVDDAVRDQVLAGAASANSANHVAAFEQIPSAVDTSVAPLTLLDALYAPKDSALRNVVEIMLRLENISHILVWSKGDVEDAAVDALPAMSVRKLERVEPSIDYIELPRLALSFRCESVPVGSKGHSALRLYCEQHEGMYLRCVLICLSLLICICLRCVRLYDIYGVLISFVLCSFVAHSFGHPSACGCRRRRRVSWALTSPGPTSRRSHTGCRSRSCWRTATGASSCSSRRP